MLSLTVPSKKKKRRRRKDVKNLYLILFNKLTSGLFRWWRWTDLGKISLAIKCGSDWKFEISKFCDPNRKDTPLTHYTQGRLNTTDTK